MTNRLPKADESKCGAKRRGKHPCGLPAGWGTDHVGSGRCRKHLGNTDNGKKAATEEAAIQFAVGALGAEVELDPLEAQLQSVRLAAGLVSYWRHQLAAERPAPGSMEGLERAATMLNRFSKNALDAGIDAKLVAIAERMVDQIALAAEEALGALVATGLTLTAEQRTIYARALEVALTKREEAPLIIQGTAVERPALAAGTC